MSRQLPGLRVPLKQLRIHLEKLGDTANIWSHWEMIQSLAVTSEKNSEDEGNTSETVERDQVIEHQKALVFENKQKTQNQRKRKHRESSSRDIETVMETEEFQCAGTLEKPALAYVTKNDRKGGIRFYVKIEGSIKAMKYKFCKVDGSFFVYCCTQQGLNCEAKHLIRCKEEALMRYNKSSRVWRLNFDHQNIYSPSSFEVVYSETCPHTCKELTRGNFKSNQEKSVSPYTANISATDAENVDAESFALQFPDEKYQPNENKNMETDVSIVIPAKRRKSMRASSGPLLPIPVVPNIISEKSSRKSSGGKMPGVPSVDTRLVKVDNNVPKLNESRCILSGECSSCCAVFSSWEQLIAHIIEDEDCKKYYVEDNRNYCFICDRPFKVLRTHCHDVLKGKCTYADKKQIKEAHAAYSRIAFKNFRNTEWDGTPKAKESQFGLQGDVAVEVQMDSRSNGEQSELEIDDVTESYQEENLKPELSDKENDPEINFGDNTAEEYGKTDIEDNPAVENSNDSPSFFGDSFEKPPLEPPGLEDVPLVFGETPLIKTEWPDLPVSFAT